MAKQLNVNLAFTADTGKAKVQIQELQTLLNQIAYTGAISSSTGQLQQDLQKASSAAKELQFHLNNAFNATTGKFDLSLLDKSLKSSKSNITDLSTSLLSAGSTGQQAFLKLAQSISLADQPMLRISNRMREFGTVMKNTIKWQLSSSMIHGFMGALQSAYGYAQDLNASLNDIRIVTGNSSAEMAKFAEQANKAAKSLSTTTTDYTKASLIYFQQGLNEKEVAERTNVTVKMANATGTSAQVVSDQMTAIWNNFDDGSKSLEYYADVLTALGAATASSTDEISQGLEKFAAVSETVGLSYEYATAALTTIMSNTRESADVVGTALKTLFARIQGLQLGETLEDGTDLNKYSQALDKVGISIYEQNGELKAMDNILDEMAAKWDTLGNAEQTALAQTVAGVRQYTQLVALMENWDNGDSDSFKANINTIAGASGTLDQQAEIYAQSWEAAEKRVRAAAEGIYQSLLDDDFFISLNNGFANVLGGIDAFIDGLGGVSPLITSIASIFISNFSHKIPQALDDLKYNLSLLSPKGTENAYKKIQDDMTAASNKQFALYESSKGDKGIDANSSMGYAIKSANELTAARTKLALVSDRMSASEKQMAQSQLSLIEAAQQETIALKQKNEELEKNIDLSLKSMTDGIRSEEAYDKGYNRGGEVIKNIDMDTLGLNASTDLESMGGEIAQNLGVALTQQFAKMKQEVAEGKRSIQEFMQESMKLDTIAVGGEKVSNAFKEIASKVQSLNQGGDINSIKENILSFVDILPKGVQQTEAFKKAINSIKEAKGPDELKQSFADLEKALHNTELKGKDIRKILTELHGKNIADLYNNMEQFANGTAEAEKKVSALQKMLQEFQPTHIVRMSEAFGALGGIAGNTVSIIRSVSSAAQALSNPDLSGWEKFTTVLTSVSMIVPGLMSMMRGLGTAQAFANAQVQASIASLTAEQVARITGMSITEASIAIQNAKAAAAVREAAAEKGTITVSQLVSMVRAKELTSTQALTIAKQLKAGATLKEAMAEAGLTAVKGGAIGAAIAHTTALVAETMAAWGLNAALAPLIAVLLLFAVAVGSVILVGAGFVAAFNAIKNATPEGQLRAAKEEAASLADSLKEAEQAAQDLKSAFDEYDSAINKLKECEEGTQEWRSALHEVNGEVLDLLNKYPELASMTKNQDGTGESAIYKDPETGQLQIRDWARDRMIAEAEEAVLNVRAASTQANQRVREAEIRQDTSDLAKQLNREKNTTGTQIIKGDNGEDVIIDASHQIASYIAKNAQAFQTDEAEQRALLESYFKDNNISGNIDGWIAAIGELNGPISTLSASIDANTAAIQYENEAIVDSALADSEKVQDSQYGDLITEKIAQADYQAEVDRQRAQLIADGWGTNWINKATGVNDQARTIFDEYAKAAGITGYDLTDTTGTDANRNFVYTDANGQEITVSLDKMLDVVANQKAQEKIQIDAEGLADQLAQHEVTGKDKETVDSLLKSGLAGLTDEQRKAGEESGDIGSILIDEAMASMEAAFNVLYGDEGAAKLQAWLESLNQQIADWQPEQFDLDAWKADYAASKDIVSGLKVGDTIDQSEYDQLDAAAQQFFTATGDGIYTLTQNAELLRDVVNDIAAQALKDEIAEINNLGGMSQKTANQHASNIEAGNAAGMAFLNSGADEAYIEDVNAKYGTSFTEFAEAVAYVNERLGELQSNLAATADQLGELDILMASGQISSGDYINQLQALAAQYENCTDELANYQRALAEGNEEAANAADAALRGAIRAGELAKQYGLSAEAIERYAEELKDSGKYANASSKALAEMAKDQLRFDRAVENSRKNMKQWKQDLQIAAKTGHLASESAEQMAEAYGDLLDIDGDLLPSSFLKDVDNLKLMEQALKGDEAAYQSLLDKSRQAIAMKIGLDDTAFQNGFNDLLSKYYQAQSLDDIQVGASLDNAGFLQGLTDMVNAANMTAAEATSYLASMGVDAEVVEEPTVSEDTQTYVSATPNISWHSSAGTNPVTGGPALYTFPEVHYSTSTETIPTSKTTTGVALRVVSANKSSGGAIKHSGSSAAAAPSSGGGGGSQPKEPTHAEKKNTSDKTRYHTLQNQLEDLTAEYDKLAEAADRAFGADKLEAIDAEINKTDELIKKQEEYLQAIQADLPVDKSIMQAYYQDLIGGSIQFDENGNISNYDQIQDAMFNKYNQMTSLDEESEEWQVFEKKYEQLEKYIEQYEETYDLLRDEEASYQELLNQRIDLELEKVTYKTEIQLEVPESQVEVIEYQLGRIEDDVDKTAESIALLTKQAESLYDQIQINKQGINEALELSLSTAEINELMAGNMNVLNGKSFTEDQIDAIKDYRDNLLELNEEFDDLREEVEETILNAFDELHEALSDGIEQFDHYNSMLESYRTIIETVGKDTLGISNGLINTLSQITVKNAINQVKATQDAYKALQQTQLEAEQQLEKAKARGDEQSIAFWEDTLNEIQQNAQEAQEEMMSAWEEALTKIAEQFEAAVQTAVDAFNEAVYQLGGIEALSSEFDRQKEMADMYLDDYQKIYELSKLNRDVNNSIDDTDSLAGKQKLKKLLGEINKLQAEGVKMSEYDLEYLQAEYDLRMAEIALEEAQRAKDVVRLQRDNEGNWSYVYTQNTEAVDEAQQKYEDALYAMQDLSSNYIDEISAQLIETSQEMQEALAAIRIEDYASIEEYYEEVERVQEQYQEQLAMQEEELNKAVANNKELYDTDWMNYHNAVGYKISDTEQFATKFSDTLLGTLTNSKSDTSNFTDILSDATTTLMGELYTAAEQYYTNMANAMQAAGTSTGTFADDLATNVDQIKQDSEEAATAVEDMAENMQQQMDNIMNKVAEWQRTYSEAMNEIINSNLAVIESFNEMLATLSMDDSKITVTYDIQNANQDILGADQFDTGGYTGEWGNTGKYAVLHEKELVLNKQDTENMVEALKISRAMLNTIELNAQQASLGLGAMMPATIRDDVKETLEQVVSITAEFPNATNHNEIEEAFNTLINRASQYANRK